MIRDSNSSADTPLNERGAALLPILLLVGVMAVLAAVAVDRLNVATRTAINHRDLDQARSFVLAAENIALQRLQDLGQPGSTEATQINGLLNNEIDIPVGSVVVSATALDAGNCFNLNSVVSGQTGNFVKDNRHVSEFLALLASVDTDAAQAELIAGSLVDWIDSDELTQPKGAEDAYYSALEQPYRTAAQLLVDPSELRAIRGMTSELYLRLAPWICALPMARSAPLNLNSLRPDQARLLAFRGGGFGKEQAIAAVLGRRPVQGYQNVSEFLRQPALQSLRSDGLTLQPDWLQLVLRAKQEDIEVQTKSLVDLRLKPARIVSRQWGR